jgi:hypothetical protein
VIGWVAVSLSGVWLGSGKDRRRSDEKLLTALDDSAASNRRLAAIETTLTEIP